MIKKFIEVSPFWSYLSFYTPMKLLIICLIFLINFEIIARISPLILGKYVHKPFSISQISCVEECDMQGNKILWKTNERGARGDLYRGQGIQVAVFGSSTTSNTEITQELTWPEQIKANIEMDIHVDNFARDGAGNKEVESILNHLIKIKQHYNAILIMDHYAHEEREVNDSNAFQDWGRDSTDKFFLKSPILISGYLLDKSIRLHITQHLEKVINIFNNDQNPSEFKHPPPTARSNRELRNSGKIKFVDTQEELVTKEKQEYIYSRVKRLSELARMISPKVYFITQPVAFDENELPGVSKRWFSLYPVSNDQPYYKSNKSVALEIRNSQTIVERAAIQNNAEVIELDQYIRPMLSDFDDLFFDKWHMAPKGNQLAGKFIANRLVHDGVL